MSIKSKDTPDELAQIERLGKDLRQEIQRNLKDNVFAASNVATGLLVEWIERVKAVASGHLRQSVETVVDDEGFRVLIEHYYKYVDKGVSGTERKFNTPYAFTKKMPPVKAMQNFANFKGIGSVRGIAYRLQRTVFKYGIKPRGFIEKAYSPKNIEAIQKILQK